MGHELVHVDQIMLGNTYGGSNYNNINELEAYDWELANYQKFGLTRSEYWGITSVRNKILAGIDPYYVGRASQGNYLVAPWDR
jgi:hypothetical protein